MITVTVVLIVLATFYWYLTRTYKYWEKRRVKHDKPVLFFGTNTQGYLLQKSISQIAEEMYWKYPGEKVVGFFRSTRPELVIRDPALVRHVLQTDFSSFYSRGLNPNKEVIEPIMKNLFVADGDVWRLLRQRITPAFTSSKLKAMFPLIIERAERLQARVLAAAAASKPLDARDLMARYTTDFIGACGFGLDADSLNDENSEFRKLGTKIFKIPLKDAIVAVIKEIFPDLAKHLKFMTRIEKDLNNLVHQILVNRNYEPSGRNDFIDLLLECRKKGLIVGESLEKMKPDGTPETTSLELTEDLIAAQVFIFFAAGFETSSTATSSTLLQLAFHPEVQKKVQANIDQALHKYNNKLCYDAVKEMSYLEWAFNESVRIFPPVGYLVRECARQYTFRNSELTIDKGVRVLISLQALHNDPQYFEDPDVFRPERFDPAEFDFNKNKYVYLPFGEGPRACLGARLGLMQSLAGLAAVLSRFSVEPAPTTVRKPRVDPKARIVQVIKDDIILLFRERKTVNTF